MDLTDKWLEGVRQDLNSELRYVLDEFGLQAAEKAFRKVVETIDILCQFPRLGKRFGDIVYHGQQVYVLNMKQISIIYCQRDDRLLVIALWNNRRDDKSLTASIEPGLTD